MAHIKISILIFSKDENSLEFNYFKLMLERNENKS